jgi:hypothetical protein
MRWIRSFATTIVLVVTVHAATAAEQSRSREAFFRCKDRSGQTRYGDSVPPECEGLDTEVLNDRGIVLRIIEGEKTRASRMEREAVEAKARKEREQRELRDHTLIETYLTVEDIERLRDQRLELLVAQHRVTEQNLASLRERQARLEQQISRFRPYSDKPNAPPLPENLAAEIVNTVRGLRVYQESLDANTKEQAHLSESFAADIKRFKELKGIK